ncbi:MAG: DUF3293 domain-containing protein [Rhodanobacteraceae bacterium]
MRSPGGGHACIRCGSRLPAPLLALLRHADESWGYVTAWNPAGVRLPAAVNRERQRRLRDELNSVGHRYRVGVGVGADGWRETSLFVPGIAFAELDDLARRFGQLGVVRGTGSGLAELHELV